METKRCKTCEKELPRPIDEFGDIREPLCISCWLNPETTERTRSENRIDVLEQDISELEEEIDGLESEISSLRGDVWDKKGELRKLKDAIKKGETTAFESLMAADL